MGNETAVQVLQQQQQSKQPIWIQNAAQLITLASDKKGPRTKRAMSELHIIEGGSMWIEDGKVRAIGTMQQMIPICMPRAHEAKIVDATGKIITPGLIDPHTHIVHGGSREFEFELRIQGKGYMEILQNGGGIHATTEKTREISEEQIYNDTALRLDSFLQHGVTTLESKSGYGLDLETELKQLRIMNHLNEKHPIDIITAFVYYITERIREKCDFSKVYARIVFAGSFLDVLYVVYGAYSGALYRIENGKTVYGVLNNYLGIAQFVVVVAEAFFT